MAESDYVQFAEDEEQREMFLRSGWEGQWPPPKEIGLLFGKKSGRAHRMVLGEEGETEVRKHLADQGFDFDTAFEIRWFKQVSVSQISDEDIATMTNVARGAAYAPKED